MEDDDEIDITIDEIKPCRSKSGFYLGESKNKIKDDTSNKLIEPKKNNNKKECTFCSFNLNGWFSIINLIGGALGGGVLSFPEILKNIGMVSGLICFILVSVSVYYSLDLLRRFVVDTKLFSYSDITKTTLGYFWLIMYAISSFIIYMSCISSYINSLSKITKSIFHLGEDIPLEKFIYFFIFYIIEVILCIFTSNVSRIHILSTICFCIFLIILIIVIIDAIIIMSTREKLDYIKVYEVNGDKGYWEKFLIIMAKVIELLVGFLSHATFPTLLNFYNSPNDDEKTKKINKVQFIILNVIYGLFTIFGFFCLTPENNEFLQPNCNNPKDYIIHILLMIYLIALIPIRYIIIRDNYTSVLKKDYLQAKIEIPTTCICLLICNIAAFFAKEILSEIFINIFTSIFGVFICFILPVINFVKLNDKTKIRSIIGYIVSSIFIIIGIFSIIFFIKQQGKNNP